MKFEETIELKPVKFEEHVALEPVTLNENIDLKPVTLNENIDLKPVAVDTCQTLRLAPLPDTSVCNRFRNRHGGVHRRDRAANSEPTAERADESQSP